MRKVLAVIRREFLERVRRKWDEAATPYERLQATDVLEQETAERLAGLRTTTNPRRLRRAIYDAIPRLWDLPARPASARRVA